MSYYSLSRGSFLGLLPFQESGRAGGKKNARRLRTSPKPRIGRRERPHRAWRVPGKRRETDESRGSRMRTQSTAGGVQWWWWGEAALLVCGARALTLGSGAYRKSSSFSAPEKADLKPFFPSRSTCAALPLRDIVTLFAGAREMAQPFRKRPAYEPRPPLPAPWTTRPYGSPQLLDWGCLASPQAASTTSPSFHG